MLKKLIYKIGCNAGNEAFERVASIGLAPNMITYLMREYNMGLAQVTNLLFFCSAASNFMPVLGAFLSDSYLGRFQAIAFGSIASFLVFLSLFQHISFLHHIYNIYYFMTCLLHEYITGIEFML